jgi:hypothetical protein
VKDKKHTYTHSHCDKKSYNLMKKLIKIKFVNNFRLKSCLHLKSFSKSLFGENLCKIFFCVIMTKSFHNFWFSYTKVMIRWMRKVIDAKLGHSTKKKSMN